MISAVVLQQGGNVLGLGSRKSTSYEEALGIRHGLVNRVEYDDDTHKDAPELFFNTGRKNIDFHHPTKCG